MQHCNSSRESGRRFLQREAHECSISNCFSDKSRKFLVMHFVCVDICNHLLHQQQALTTNNNHNYAYTIDSAPVSQIVMPL